MLKDLNYWIIRMKQYHLDPTKRQEICQEVFCDLKDFIHKRANDFGGVDHEDLFQVGSMAIVENIGRYNPAKKKCIPITFFAPYIVGAMYVLVAKTKNVSKNDMTVHKKINDARKKLEAMGSPVTVRNIVKVCNNKRITDEVVYNNLRIMGYSNTQIHLDNENDQGSDNKVTSVADFILTDISSDSVAADPFEKMVEFERNEVLLTVLKQLSILEQKILLALEVEEKSISDLTKELNLSAVEIKRHRTHAILELRRNPKLKRYMGKTDEDILSTETEPIIQFKRVETPLTLDETMIIEF